MLDLNTTAQQIEILYTNYRGETAWRRIVPVSIRFGSTEFHKDPQWLLDALDLDKQAERSFALAEVEKWKRE